MTEFTPISAFIGGSLIGLSALILMLGIGRVAGCSGIVTAAITGSSGEQGARRWRLAFITGLVLGPVIAGLIGSDLPTSYSFDWTTVIIGGLLVGFGAAVGGGCTSGHGICGMGRLSVRSIAATCMFMATGFATVFVVQHVI